MHTEKFRQGMSHSLALLLSAGLSIFVTAAAAQESKAPAATTANQYLIGPGDVLDIRIYNRPLLSRESVRVDERGMIRLPLINEIKAECRTESDLSNGISKSYLEYLKNPHVEVFIKDYQSKPVMVLGAVRAPGRFQLQRQVSLVEIVSLAGGLSETAGGRIQVTHSSTRSACDEADEMPNDSVDLYDIDELLQADTTGKPVPYVKPGDTVNLLEADRAFIVGNVLKPSVIPLKEPVTVSQAVAIAGGTLPDSKLGRVRILRQPASGGPKGEMIVDLKAINRQEAEDVVLQSNDIIEVPTSTGKKILRGIANGLGAGLTRLPVQVIR